MDQQSRCAQSETCYWFWSCDPYGRTVSYSTCWRLRMVVLNQMEPPTLPSLINFPFKVATPPSLKSPLKPYQKLAMDLIFLCRLFVRAREQSLNYTTQLRNVLIATDDALSSAAEAGSKASSELDEKFVKVINMLDDFDHAFCSEDPVLGQNVDGAVIEAAKRSDMSEFSLATLSLHEDAAECACKNNGH
ncbi:hypothetical protein F5888DRAFT_564351 [Russula emetica]|nr:hypothetical protein F5888DRAFT_564351 [Russula emetica]